MIVIHSTSYSHLNTSNIWSREILQALVLIIGFVNKGNWILNIVCIFPSVFRLSSIKWEDSKHY